MEEQNRVNVKIYGQEFTISGDQPRTHILKIADHVDRRMHELANLLPSCSAGALAVLAAVNTADEYFQEAGTMEDLKAINIQLEKDVQHYVQLWDEAKRNFLQHKEDIQTVTEQRELLQRQCIERADEIHELREKIIALEEQKESLQRKLDNLMDRMEAQEDEKESELVVVKELEARCKDMENSFFDLQMENIQLKAELDRYKKIVE